MVSSTVIGLNWLPSFHLLVPLSPSKFKYRCIFVSYTALMTCNYIYVEASSFLSFFFNRFTSHAALGQTVIHHQTKNINIHECLLSQVSITSRTTCPNWVFKSCKVQPVFQFSPALRDRENQASVYIASLSSTPLPRVQVA